MTRVPTNTTRELPGWLTAVAGWLPTPAGATAAERRAYAIARHGVPAGVLAHAAYVPLFAWWGVLPMAAVNVISVLVWALSAMWARQGRLTHLVWVLAAEIVVHAALVWVFIGWGFGVQYVLINWLIVVSLFSVGMRLPVRVAT